MSFNKWEYTYDNPLRYIDPSGYISEDQSADADKIVSSLLAIYNVRVIKDWGSYTYTRNPQDQTRHDSCWDPGVWSMNELTLLQTVVSIMAGEMHGPDIFKRNLGGVTVEQVYMQYGGLGDLHSVKLPSNSAFGPFVIAHEFGHAWDANEGWSLSRELEHYTGGYTDLEASKKLISSGACDLQQTSKGDYISNDSPGERGRLPGCNAAGYFYHDTPSGANYAFDKREDFASSVGNYVLLNSSISDWKHQVNCSVTRWDPNGIDPTCGPNDERGSTYFPDYSNLFYSGDYRTTSRYKFVDMLMNPSPNPSHTDP
jgi:hypothetical protein